jgi:hypothetical protein
MNHQKDTTQSSREETRVECLEELDLPLNESCGTLCPLCAVFCGSSGRQEHTSGGAGVHLACQRFVTRTRVRPHGPCHVLREDAHIYTYSRRNADKLCVIETGVAAGVSGTGVSLALNGSHEARVGQIRNLRRRGYTIPHARPVHNNLNSALVVASGAIPMLADRNMPVTCDCGSITFRGSRMIDPNGTLHQITVNDLPVG